MARLLGRVVAQPAAFAGLFVRGSPDPEQPASLFLDAAVYSRNRAFRLYRCAKAGKPAVLWPTLRHAAAALLRRRGLAEAEAGDGAAARGAWVGGGAALVPRGLEALIAREAFLGSLVVVPRADRLLRLPQGAGPELPLQLELPGPAAPPGGGDEGEDAYDARGEARAPPPLRARIVLPRLGGVVAAGGGGGGGGGAALPARGAAAAGGACGWGGSSAAQGYPPSPFPAVDAFIEAVCVEVRGEDGPSMQLRPLPLWPLHRLACGRRPGMTGPLSAPRTAGRRARPRARVAALRRARSAATVHAGQLRLASCLRLAFCRRPCIPCWVSGHCCRCG
jgi:hypothetical protein